MAMARWKPSKETLGGFKCIEFGPSRMTELGLAGEYGEIWPNGEGYKAVVTAARVANELARARGSEARYKQGEEAIVSFPASQLNMMRKKLRVPLDPVKQAIFANSFPFSFRDLKITSQATSPNVPPADPRGLL